MRGERITLVTDGIERRRHPRIQQTLEMLLHLETETLCGVTCRNFSLSGMLLILDRDVDVGETGRVELYQECDRDVINLSVAFKIIRKEESMPHAFGIELTDMTDEDGAGLSRIIDYVSGH